MSAPVIVHSCDIRVGCLSELRIRDVCVGRLSELRIRDVRVGPPSVVQGLVDRTERRSSARAIR